MVHAKDDASKKASYAELIGGRYFNVQLDWNKQMGNPLYAPGKAKPKDPKDHKIVGKPIAREDIAPKVYAQEDFCTDVKLPGMVHGRMIRPAIAGSVPVKVDDSSIKDIPGAKVVWEKGFLGVVADKEWDAIKAAQKLKVEWSDAKPPFPEQAALYEHIRKAPVRKREIGGKEVGNVDEVFKTAARVVEAEYEWPFQSHACMGPACAVVEIKDGNVTCWTGSQKPHFVAERHRRARSASRPRRSARSGWSAPAPTAAATPTTRPWTPPCWRKRSASRCACNTRASRRPAGTRRVPPRSTAPAPPSTRSGNVIAYEFTSKGFSRIDVQTNGSKPPDTLAGQLRGVPLVVNDGFGVPAESYEFANKRIGVGDDCAAARPRLAAAQRASARSGRTADPFRQRVVHRRGGGGAQPRSRSSSACATSRMRATSR